MVSIIICTYNRVKYLIDTINSLKQYLESFQNIELIIVDNASKDNTSVVCKDLIRAYPLLNIRYIYETKIGLAHARNRGINESEGEIVIFLDDDAIPKENWLSAILDVFVTTNAYVVGGKVDLNYETNKPKWITSELESMLTKLDIGNEVKKIDINNCWLVGANLGFRKKILERVGLFNIQLGRKGEKLISNEETELIKRISKVTNEIYYTPFAIVDHFVPKERLILKWFIKRSFYGGYSSNSFTLEKKNKIENIALNIFLIIKYILMFLITHNKKVSLIKTAYVLGVFASTIKQYLTKES
ncbi:MAG: glycosyltransferase [Melioribacteraceae bacterium]